MPLGLLLMATELLLLVEMLGTSVSGLVAAVELLLQVFGDDNFWETGCFILAD